MLFRSETEDEHRNRVLGPAHLMRFVDAGQLVDDTLERAEDDIGERLFASEDPCHIDAHGFRTYEYEGKEEEYLKPAVGGHNLKGVLLKLFWL